MTATPRRPSTPLSSRRSTRQLGAGEVFLWLTLSMLLRATSDGSFPFEDDADLGLNLRRIAAVAAQYDREELASALPARPDRLRRIAAFGIGEAGLSSGPVIEAYARVDPRKVPGSVRGDLADRRRPDGGSVR